MLVISSFDIFLHIYTVLIELSKHINLANYSYQTEFTINKTEKGDLKVSWFLFKLLSLESGRINVPVR